MGQGGSLDGSARFLGVERTKRPPTSQPCEALPWFEKRKRELTNRPLLREQAFGDSLDPDKLECLGRYEVRLDRKLERMLSMLLRLKDLRRAQLPTESV
jgi:hypothetical protein